MRSVIKNAIEQKKPENLSIETENDQIRLPVM